MDDTVCGGGADKGNLAPDTDQIFSNEANHKLTDLLQVPPPQFIKRNARSLADSVYQA